MWIVAIAWIYVVGLMAVTEPSVVAGVMTFLAYCVVPLSILFYLTGGKRRRARRAAADDAESDDSASSSSSSGNDSTRDTGTADCDSKSGDGKDSWSCDTSDSSDFSDSSGGSDSSSD